MIDQPTHIRAGEELNRETLEAYLRAHVPNAKASDSLQIQQFPSGFSNLTYFLQFGEAEFVLRRPPFGANVKGGHDMHREYRILHGLSKSYPKAPKPLVYCEDVAVLGAPFYVMERVQGLIVRSRLPKGFSLTAHQFQQISMALVDTLVELHQVDYVAAALADLGNPVGYVGRQVNGWIKRYQAAQTDEIGEMDAIAAWLTANMPPESGQALIHNDYKYDNVVLNPANVAQIVAVLDWEMATIGDPLMDLGTTLGYWANADDPVELRQFSLTHLPGNLTRQAVAEHYAERSGRALTNLVFYYAFGLFKIGVILQQIYARYRKGLTQDARFASLIYLEKAMARMGVRAIELGRIDQLGA